MSYGVVVGSQKAKSKKAVKEAIVAAPETVEFYSTSVFGPTKVVTGVELAELAAAGGVSTFNFVGPCPYTDRKFYGTVKVVGGKVKVS